MNIKFYSERVGSEAVDCPNYGKQFFSIMDFFLWCLLTALLANDTGCACWDKTAPIAFSDASVVKTNFCFKSVQCNTGQLVKRFFNFSKAAMYKFCLYGHGGMPLERF